MTAKTWAGLDVGVETTSLCVINDAGEILQEARCPTDLACIHRELRGLRRRRHSEVGLEAGAATLARGLRTLGYSVTLYETRQLSKFLRVRRNKTDAGDAIGIAEAGRIGASLVSKVHLKSLECQLLQSRLTIRRHLVRQRVATVNLLCRQIESYGGRIAGPTRRLVLRSRVEAELNRLFGKQEGPVQNELRKLVAHCEDLIARQYAIDRELKRLATETEVCRRFMEIPGVGPLAALTFYAVVGDPDRFTPSTDVGSYLGLTPKLHQSGLSSRSGRISRMGNVAARTLLVQAAITFMRLGRTAGTELRSWTVSVEERRGRGRSRIALARKLAVIMVSMWKSGECFVARPAVES